MKGLFPATGVVLAFAGAAWAADVWVFVDANCVNDGEPVWVAVASGSVFPIGEQPIAPDAIAGIVDRGPRGVNPITGLKSRDANYSVRRPLNGTGIHVIGCEMAAESPPRHSDTASGDNSSLTASATRRFAKTIVSVEPAGQDDQSYSTLLGHELEIVPLTNPCQWRAGETVSVQVALEGHPWPGVQVHAGHEGNENSSYAASTMTDAGGLACITLQHGGHWFITAELSRSVPGFGKVQVEFLRASMTFRVRSDGDVGPSLLAVRAIHGGLDPAAVAGYRIGTGVLGALRLPAGSDELQVTHWSPLDPRFAGAVDGLQASTRTSPGRLSLRLEEAPSAADIQTVCTNRATGQRVVCRMRPELRQLIQATTGQERQDAALRVAVMPDERLFEITSVGAGTVAIAKQGRRN